MNAFYTGWVCSINHKDIAMMSFVLAIWAGIIQIYALFVDGQIYDVLFTGHGLKIILFLVMPALLSGLSFLLVPILIGAADKAFPHMNFIWFWLLPPLIIISVHSTLVEQGAGTGGTDCPPLCSLLCHDFFGFISSHLLCASIFMIVNNFVVKNLKKNTETHTLVLKKNHFFSILLEAFALCYVAFEIFQLFFY